MAAAEGALGWRRSEREEAGGGGEDHVGPVRALLGLLRTLADKSPDATWATEARLWADLVCSQYVRELLSCSTLHCSGTFISQGSCCSFSLACFSLSQSFPVFRSPSQS